MVCKSIWYCGEIYKIALVFACNAWISSSFISGAADEDSSSGMDFSCHRNYDIPPTWVLIYECIPWQMQVTCFSQDAWLMSPSGVMRLENALNIHSIFSRKVGPDSLLAIWNTLGHSLVKHRFSTKRSSECYVVNVEGSSWMKCWMIYIVISILPIGPADKQRNTISTDAL